MPSALDSLDSLDPAAGQTVGCAPNLQDYLAACAARIDAEIALVLEGAEQHLEVASGHDLLAIEPSEDPRRATAIEATAVIKNPQPHPFTLEGARHFGKGDRPSPIGHQQRVLPRPSRARPPEMPLC